MKAEIAKRKSIKKGMKRKKEKEGGIRKKAWKRMKMEIARNLDEGESEAKWQI